ncbi:MAG: SIMPL domain-containing protein [Clostridia bacterium]|nr:SIMPL domain-containing protein [Clostridia bacterium]
MKKLIVLALAFCLLLCPAALADSEITVQGMGTVCTAPDIAVITVGAEEVGEDVAAIQSAVNQRINAVIEAWTNEGGIPRENIQTNDYSIYRRWYDNYGNPVNDFVASCSLRVTIDNIDLAGVFVDQAFKAGANTLNDITFSIADSSELADKALALAVADGMHRAQIIAEAAGITLPAVPTRVSEGGDVYYSVNTSRAMVEKFAGSADVTQLMAGTVEIVANVTVTYVIKD